MFVNIAIIGRRWGVGFALAAVVTIGFAEKLPAQIVTRDTTRGGPLVITDSALRKMFPDDSIRVGRARFRRRFAAGFVTSILIHESAHFAASYLLGVHPHLGFNGWRPTVYSGINEGEDARKQFIFSAAGLTVQDLLDEAILDFPHRRGGSFERGLLTGGIGTTLFYISLGRNASVSDISVMARTSSLSKTQLSLIFGSVAAMHTVRIALDHHYARFFAAPTSTGGLRAGLSITAD